jgi:hypothetical protein
MADSMRNPRLMRLVRTVLLVCAVCCLILSAAIAAKTLNFLQTAIRTNGHVVKLITQTDTDNATSYAPVFEFTAQDGITYTKTSRVSTNPPEFSVGASVQVLYPPGNPGGAKIAAFWQLWLPSITLAFIAIVQGMIAGAILWQERGQAPRASSEAIPTPDSPARKAV